ALPANLQRIGVVVGAAREIDRLPAAPGGVAFLVEVTVGTRLGITHEGQPTRDAQSAALADEREEAAQRLVRAGQHLGHALGARPARLAGWTAAFALVEGGRVEARAARQTGGRQSMLGSQTVNSPPDLGVAKHVPIILKAAPHVS